MKNSLVEKLGMGVLGASILLGANSLDANAQKRKYPDKHIHGNEFYNSKGNSKISLEETIFNNQVTGEDERFYMGYVDKDKYENDLNFVSLDFYKTIPRSNLKTGVVPELTSKEGMYNYFPVKMANGELANSIVIKNLHIAGWCDDQIREAAGVTKGTNYISTKDIADLFPEHQRLKVNGEDFIVLTVPKALQVEGKTNHYLIPADEQHEIGFDPVSKDPIIYGLIYRGVLEKGPVTVDAKPGIGSDIGRDESFKEKETKEPEKQKVPTQKGNLSLILGANANDKFFEGNLGIQAGPIAFVANYGQGEDENLKTIKTNPSPNTGRYHYATKDSINTQIFGLAAEFHPPHKRKVSSFFGVGINKWSYEININEQIKDSNGNVVASNSKSQQKSAKSCKGVAGINFKVGKGKLGLQAGYDTRSKFFGGVRYSIKLGK